MNEKLFITVVNAIVDAKIASACEAEIWGMFSLACKLGLDNERLYCAVQTDPRIRDWERKIYGDEE